MFESKLTAVGYGFFIPFFFVVSGINFDLDALVDTPFRVLELPMFLGLFLIVRGVPALVLYRNVLDRSERIPLAVFSATELPLVVAITTIAVEEGHMRSGTAAALVGAGILSTAILPILGLQLRARSQACSQLSGAIIEACESSSWRTTCGWRPRSGAGFATRGWSWTWPVTASRRCARSPRPSTTRSSST